MNVDGVLRLAQSEHNYELGGNKLLEVEGVPASGIEAIIRLIGPMTANTGPIIVVGSGVPGAATAGLIYIRTDGTAEDTRLYLRGNPATNDWNPVLGGT